MSQPDASALSDAALRDRIAYLHGVEIADEDALSGAGYRELHALEAERDRRESLRCACCRRVQRVPLAPGTICATCAGWPLD